MAIRVLAKKLKEENEIDLLKRIGTSEVSLALEKSKNSIRDAKYVILTLKVGENTIIYFDYSIPITIASLIADLEQTKNRKISNNNLENLSVSTDKLQDNSVTPNKTTFFERGGKNLFNPNDPNILQGKYLGRDNIPLANSRYIITGYIPFKEEDKNLIVSTNGRNQDGGGFSFIYDKDLNPIKG